MFSRIVTRRILKSIPLKTMTRHIADEPQRFERISEIGVNSVTLMGRVGADPEKRGSETHPVVIFSLATNTIYSKYEGVKEEKVEWHRICVFKPGLRETVYNYLKKGQRLYVSGKLNYGQYTNEKGEKSSITSIIADDIIFVAAKP